MEEEGGHHNVSSDIEPGSSTVNQNPVGEKELGIGKGGRGDLEVCGEVVPRESGVDLLSRQDFVWQVVLQG
jgi:hypothetical protein